MKIRILLFASLILPSLLLGADERPCMVFTGQDTRLIRENLGKYPMFDSVFVQAKSQVERALAVPMDVPLPKDAGGYTHERHKQNYTEMYLAGLLYSVTGEERYAVFVREMLRKYAALYPTLGEHPARAGESAGRLFWQSLNETVWLMHASQAYDFIYNWLKPADRELFEKNIFRPMTEFFTVDRVSEHDRIHNHGTWMVAAVGMAGYAMRDQDLVDKALYGTKKDSSAGFLKQVEQLFSPDGFYTEGLYYFRYAIMPFILFAQAIENNQPGLKIFEYRDQIFRKAVYTGLQLTNMNGDFFPINDAMKEKNYRSPEVILALAIIYQRYGQDPALLSIAKQQGSVALLGAGVSVAKALTIEKKPPLFPYRSMEFTDGERGDEGGFAVLRSGSQDDQLVVGLKYTGHGLSHGHYDKLSILAYDAGHEILQDYGAARFMNVESKFGGRYLPETKAFAMQSIAHNTVVVDEKSHYDEKISISEKQHGDRQYFHAENPDFQVTSATCTTAYPGVAMQRTMAMIRDEKNSKPVVLDLFRVVSDREHQYDLPFYYVGQFLYSSVPYTAYDKKRTTVGSANGYQYLWKEAEGKPSGPVKFSWLNGSRYYTVTASSDTGIEVVFARIGATDPNFNLRPEGAVILRNRTRSAVFASVIEPHGLWDGNKEISRDAYGGVASVAVSASTAEGTVVQVLWKDGRVWTVLVSNQDSAPAKRHSIQSGARNYEWTGDAAIVKY
ncbi:MAG: heparinase II/III family protein [Ignavibacteriales bacterium]|nr:heparinase II/III family protein [Ignavibacteriales bacterium]